MLDEVVCLCGFVATAPVAVWVAVKDCCSVCSVLLGLFPVACHKGDATTALASLRLLSCVLRGFGVCVPHSSDQVGHGCRTPKREVDTIRIYDV